jgi:hypothetical protein
LVDFPLGTVRSNAPQWALSYRRLPCAGHFHALKNVSSQDRPVKDSYIKFPPKWYLENTTANEQDPEVHGPAFLEV